MDTSAIGLIASSCVILFLIFVLGVIVSYNCFRRLESRKTSLPRSRVQEVSEWARNVQSSTSTFDQHLDPPFRAMNGYRPKILGRAENEYVFHETSDTYDVRKGKHHRGRHHKTDDEVHKTVRNGKAISVINVKGETNRVVSGTIMPREMNGDRDSNRSSGQFVHGQIVHEDTGRVGDVTGVAPTVHVIKQKVKVGEDGRLVISSTEQGESAHAQRVYGHIETPEVVRGHHVGHGYDGDYETVDVVQGKTDGPQLVYGHHSRQQSGPTHQGPTHQGPTHHAGPSHQGPSHHDPTHHTEPTHHKEPSHHINSSYHTLEGAVPEIVVSPSTSHPPQHEHWNSDDSDDGSDAGRHRLGSFSGDKENYKVIKKHSTPKIPDWVIKSVTAQAEERDVDSDIRETALNLEHRLSTTEHRESVSEIQRRLTSSP
ncbi:uncharacterized protein LOC131928013 [Physella acuta]|uniref:uncharacterized protein LOC131928013 n=1 Tax=Physella acuta TaxID=109671 RepID=UPI0027DD0158|nr:uncharacterized protein LOC131928013 [Physella acuta]XP_059139994.1 uncharacterized protein LOC131928013 [Physella acuta]